MMKWKKGTGSYCTKKTWEAIWRTEDKTVKYLGKKAYSRFTYKPLLICPTHGWTGGMLNYFLKKQNQNKTKRNQIYWDIDLRWWSLASDFGFQKKPFISSAAEGCPFPPSSSSENGPCRSGIVLFRSRLCSDSWLRERRRRQGGGVWMVTLLPEVFQNITLTQTHGQTQTDSNVQDTNMQGCAQVLRRSRKKILFHIP